MVKVEVRITVLQHGKVTLFCHTYRDAGLDACISWQDRTSLPADVCTLFCQSTSLRQALVQELVLHFSLVSHSYYISHQRRGLGVVLQGCVQNSGDARVCMGIARWEKVHAQPMVACSIVGGILAGV